MKPGQRRQRGMVLADELIDNRSKPGPGQHRSKLADEHLGADDADVVSCRVLARIPASASSHLHALGTDPPFERHQYLRLRRLKSLQLPEHRRRPVGGNAPGGSGGPVDPMGPGQRPVGHGVPATPHPQQAASRGALTEGVAADAEPFSVRSAEHPVLPGEGDPASVAGRRLKVRTRCSRHFCMVGQRAPFAHGLPHPLTEVWSRGVEVCR